MAYVGSIESLESKLQKAAEELGSVTEETGRNAILERVKILLNEVRSSVEDRAKLSAQIERVSTEVNKLTGTNEKAREVKSVIDTVRQNLTALSSQVGKGNGKKKGFFENLFGGGFSFDGIMTSIAFSMGDLLKQTKESGFSFAKMLTPFMSIIGVDRIELASALRAQGFESIDTTKAEKFGAVLSVRKAKFPTMPMEQFAAELAMKAKAKYPNQTTIGYKELADIATEWAEIAVTPAATPGVQPVSPEVTQGNLLTQQLTIGGEKVQVNAAGKFELTRAGGVKPWKLSTKTNPVFQVTMASVDTGGNLDMALMVGNTSYTTRIVSSDLQKIVKEMATQKNVSNQVTFSAGTLNLAFEIVPA